MRQQERAVKSWVIPVEMSVGGGPYGKCGCRRRSIGLKQLEIE